MSSMLFAAGKDQMMPAKDGGKTIRKAEWLEMQPNVNRPDGVPILSVTTLDQSEQSRDEVLSEDFEGGVVPPTDWTLDNGILVASDVVFSCAFDGTVVDGNTYTFPTGAQPWAGFANEDVTIYPLSFPNGGTISFTGATAGTDADVYFRFEYNPYPDV